MDRERPPQSLSLDATLESKVTHLPGWSRYISSCMRTCRVGKKAEAPIVLGKVGKDPPLWFMKGTRKRSPMTLIF